MLTSNFSCGILLCLVLTASPFTSQEPAQPIPANADAATNQEEVQHRQMMEQSKQMEQMAKAMTSMAQMCETMMKMEMQNHPLKVAAVSIGGGLLTIALVLFVVLEIQWIRYFNLRNRNERKAQ